MRKFITPFIGALLLSGCGGANSPMVTQLYEPEPIRADNDRFASAAPNACRVEKDTGSGLVRHIAKSSFDTVCESDLTPDFVASLQRALAVRGLYLGPINSLMTADTLAAIRAYQEPQGLDSDILSLAAARQLGLKPVERLDG